MEQGSTSRVALEFENLELIARLRLDRKNFIVDAKRLCNIAAVQE